MKAAICISCCVKMEVHSMEPNVYVQNVFLEVFCQFKEAIIEVGKANLIVKVQMSVLNREFVKELNDHTSEEYKKFETEFKLQMNEIYNKIPGYKDVVIASLRAGSVIVDHDVIFEADYNEFVSITRQYEDIINYIIVVTDPLLVTINCTDESCKL
ncbi:Hypothetical predicted protein [Pelobates cultripes]|uniref:SEA domain-containing protein n=1 Tax=Pelobates cultripes TaxID=61616 RepID=A0AAD1RJP6_PELCU|nr:Hypothetical predicted protein [Pelobates cultripes]